MVYVFVMTFFIGCLVLDQRRVDKRQVTPWSAPKPDSWRPSEFSRREIVPLFFDKLLTPVMFKGPAKVSWSKMFPRDSECTNLIPHEKWARRTVFLGFP